MLMTHPAARLSILLAPLILSADSLGTVWSLRPKLKNILKGLQYSNAAVLECRQSYREYWARRAIQRIVWVTKK